MKVNEAADESSALRPSKTKISEQPPIETTLSFEFAEKKTAPYRHIFLSAM